MRIEMPEKRRKYDRDIKTHAIGRDQLLFATAKVTLLSRNTFRTRVWLPARPGPAVARDRQGVSLRRNVAERCRMPSLRDAALALRSSAASVAQIPPGCAGTLGTRSRADRLRRKAKLARWSRVWTVAAQQRTIAWMLLVLRHS